MTDTCVCDPDFVAAPVSPAREVSAEQAVKEFSARFESYFASQLSSSTAVVDRITKSAAALAGKRLRPRLVYLAALACGGETESTMRAAAVVEMVHAATLVHDDVLDGASLRRHAPACHVQWGTNPAVLLGDVLFSKAYLLAASESSPYPARRVGQAGLALCEGELQQQSTVGRWNLGREEYFEILRQKTGELCAASAALGAWSTGADASAIMALETYGRKLGMAFQVFDDWLDVWGSVATGKPRGNDIANRKPTLPTIRLLEKVDDSVRSDVVRRLDGGLLDDQLLLDLTEAGASEYTLNTAKELANQAVLALAPLSDSPAKRLLIQVASSSVCRDR